MTVTPAAFAASGSREPALIGIGPGDARYPRRLLDLRHPPDPLWVAGDPAVFARGAASIVGTRRMTVYGARVARELSGAVAAAGIVVVSGLAQGVDSAAHAGALEARGATVAVLGEGLASYLGRVRGRLRRLALDIRANGALVSEFPPDARARAWTFAQRDQTIAALGEVTVVVEAPLDSGALITARHARRLRRTVYAVPGPIGASASAGANAAIAGGAARALTGAPMLLAALGIAGRSPQPSSSGVESRVLDALAGGPADPDALARQLGLSTWALATIIARLVIRGAVACAPDGRLVRTYGDRAIRMTRSALPLLVVTRRAPSGAVVAARIRPYRRSRSTSRSRTVPPSTENRRRS